MSALRIALPVLLLAAFALAGCTGNSVTVAGQGVTSGSQSKNLQCGVDGAGMVSGTVSYGNQGAGQMDVKVTDGRGATIYDPSPGMMAGQSAESAQVKGEAGTWTLTVSTGFGYQGQWAVTLTC